MCRKVSSAAFVFYSLMFAGVITHRSSQDPPALSRWNSFASNVSIPSDIRSGSPQQPSPPVDHLL